MSNQKGITSSSKLSIVLMLVISCSMALAGAFIMTDAGQMVGISKSIVVGYFNNTKIITLVSFLILAVAVYLNYKNKVIKTWVIIGCSLLWGGSVLAAKFLAPYILFSTKQYDAEFISISDAKNYLKEDETVFVVDLNGVQRAYPREYIWQAHIVGEDFGKDNVVFTYCVMTNLPSPYINNLNGDEVNFKVLAQTNNNLLLWDTHSGEIIQQITQTCEFSKQKLEPIPVLEMTWKGFKKLYPEGKVFYNLWDTPIEKIMDAIFSTEETLYGDTWMFKTSNYDDNRLPFKEHIIGVRDDESDKQVAITKDFIKKNSPYNLTVGNRNLVISYYPEYETIVAFDKGTMGNSIDVTEIDVFGNTPNGVLERIFIYNSVHWATWAYYYPKSDVLQ